MYHPRANKRAEVAVKSAKRLLRDSIGKNGSLNNDKMVRAILQHRNNPCPISGVSPAQIVFGRVLRDYIPLQPGKFVPRKEWRIAAEKREESYAKRVFETNKRLTIGLKDQIPLQVGTPVIIQDMAPESRTFKQWTRTGVVVSVGQHNDYMVSLDGSRQISKRSRQHLKVYSPNHETWNTGPKQSSPQVFQNKPPIEVSEDLVSPKGTSVQVDYETSENIPEVPLPPIKIKLYDKWQIATAVVNPTNYIFVNLLFSLSEV